MSMHEYAQLLQFAVSDFKVKIKSVNINDVNANIGKIEYLKMEIFAYIDRRRCKVLRVQ